MKRFWIAAAVLALVGCGESDVMRAIKREEAREKQAAEEATAQSASFLAEVRGRPNVVALESGVLIEQRAQSSNQSLAMPPANAIVLVHYEGALVDGTVFDSSFARGEPAEFPLQQVVPGFSEAIQHMRPGDEINAYLPSEMGYGARGQPPRIPANATLVFRIQLLAFATQDGRQVVAPSR